MADIKQALQIANEPDKTIGILLIDFYEHMKELENDKERGGKQATVIIMAINDVKNALGQEVSRRFDKLRFDKSNHLGLGDIRLTIAQQDEFLISILE